MNLTDKFKQALGMKKDLDEPKNFRVSVTSGLPSIDRATVTQEIQQSMGKGMDMMQIDVESYNHMTPDDIEEINNLSKNQGVKWAIHADLTIDPTKADKVSWELCRNAFKEYVKVADKIKAEWVNFHSSVHVAPYLTEVMGGHPPICFSPDGKPITEYMTTSEKAIEYYFFKSSSHRTRVDGRYVTTLGVKKLKSDGKSGEEIQSMEESEIEKIGKKELISNAKEKKVPNLSNEMYEWDAYNMVAWSMYENGDYLWTSIAGGKSPDVLLEKDKDGHRKLVDAVAGRYLEEHLKSVLGELKKKNIIFTIENPDARGGQHKGEKVHRLMLPQDIYHVVKKIGHPMVRLCIDWEHIAMQGYDPWKEVDNFPEDIGKYVNKFDVNSYPNVNHIQHPVERGDVNLYKLLWKVKQKGMKSAVLNYEWGGGRQGLERWGDSVAALKDMARMLEKNVDPKELPPEFFGLGKGEMELERAQMRRNMFKPLEGSLDFPEADSGWVGKNVIQKGQFEKYRKEEYK